MKRRLTAILAADAVGYSARMAEDEERTLRTLSGHRRLIDSLIADHGGRIVGTAGDSVLAEFGSSVEAVRCAVEIQAALATRNASLTEPERLHFRIGVNLGDVIVDGADILGDGVNVASRLEGIADPGGVCISSSVFDQISGKLNLGFEDIGHKSLKNIARPVRAYRLAAASAPRRSRGGWPRLLIGAGVGVAAILAAGITAFHVSGRNGQPPSTPAAKAAQDASPTEIRTPPAALSAGAAASPPAPSSAPQEPAAPVEVPRSMPSASRGRASATGFTGGLAQARCVRPDGGPGPFVRARVQVIDGEVIIAVGEPGMPGNIDLRGRPSETGALVLEGFIIPGAGPARGTKVAARYEGRLETGRGMLTGTQGVQRCSLRVQLK